MRTVTYSCKSMAFYHTLKSLSFRGANGIQEITFHKHVLGFHGFTEIHLTFEFHPEVPEFHHLLFGGGSCLLKMAHQGLGGMFFLPLTISQLNSIVSVCFQIFYLCHYTRTSFY